MATVFNVISLGKQSDLDTQEGNASAEGASELVGLTFGSDTDPLLNHVQTFSPGSTGYATGVSNAYDLDNSPSETFRINDGHDQTFDGAAEYSATLTYVDGSTATITAVIFQDTAGNTYLAPEYSPNNDQHALDAKPIQSLTLHSVTTDTLISGLAGSREAGNFVVCFVTGTELATPTGPVAVERLAFGDLLCTLDNGTRPIRWIGKRTVIAENAMQPVCIRAGALGEGLPTRDLMVSQQHRMLIRSRIAERMFGHREVLVAARKLAGLPGIFLQPSPAQITYWHVLCDRHEVVFADGAPAETLLAGAQAQVAIGENAVADIIAACPDLAPRFEADVPARFLPSPRQQKDLTRRMRKNRKPAIEPGPPFHAMRRLTLAS